MAQAPSDTTFPRGTGALDEAARKTREAATLAERYAALEDGTIVRPDGVDTGEKSAKQHARAAGESAGAASRSASAAAREKARVEQKGDAQVGRINERGDVAVSQIDTQVAAAATSADRAGADADKVMEAVAVALGLAGDTGWYRSVQEFGDDPDTQDSAGSPAFALVWIEQEETFGDTTYPADTILVAQKTGNVDRVSRSLVHVGMIARQALGPGRTWQDVIDAGGLETKRTLKLTDYMFGGLDASDAIDQMMLDARTGSVATDIVLNARGTVNLSRQCLIDSLLPGRVIKEGQTYLRLADDASFQEWDTSRSSDYRHAGMIHITAGGGGNTFELYGDMDANVGEHFDPSQSGDAAGFAVWCIKIMRSHRVSIGGDFKGTGCTSLIGGTDSDDLCLTGRIRRDEPTYGLPDSGGGTVGFTSCYGIHSTAKIEAENVNELIDLNGGCRGFYFASMRSEGGVKEVLDINTSASGTIAHVEAINPLKVLNSYGATGHTTQRPAQPDLERYGGLHLPSVSIRYDAGLTESLERLGSPFAGDHTTSQVYVYVAADADPDKVRGAALVTARASQSCKAEVRSEIAIPQRNNRTGTDEALIRAGGTGVDLHATVRAPFQEGATAVRYDTDRGTLRADIENTGDARSGTIGVDARRAQGGQILTRRIGGFETNLVRTTPHGPLLSRPLAVDTISDLTDESATADGIPALADQMADKERIIIADLRDEVVKPPRNGPVLLSTGVDVRAESSGFVRRVQSTDFEGYNEPPGSLVPISYDTVDEDTFADAVAGPNSFLAPWDGTFYVVIEAALNNDTRDDIFGLAILDDDDFVLAELPSSQITPQRLALRLDLREGERIYFRIRTAGVQGGIYGGTDANGNFRSFFEVRGRRRRAGSVTDRFFPQ